MFYQITSVVLLIVASISSQQIGSNCLTLTNQSGICRIVTDCKSVQNDMVTRRRRETICGHINLVPVVCCPVPKRRRTTVRPSIHSRWAPLSKSESSKQNKNKIFKNTLKKLISECNEYSKYVFTNTSSSTSKDECVSTSIEYIYGGEQALPKEFPHMALLGFEAIDRTVSWSSCGGSLISELYVLTAGHCLYSQNSLLKFVRLGELIKDTNKDDAAPQDFKIIQQIKNPRFVSPSKYHDIALLRLNESVVFNAYIRPLCLPTAPLKNNDALIATGWGGTGRNGKPSKSLLKVSLDPFSYQECNNYYLDDINRKLINGIDENTQLCAGSRLYERKDTCPGDSGVPLQTYHKTTYCMYSIVAVTSFGKGCGEIGSLGVYTRVLPYVEWIESVVWPN